MKRIYTVTVSGCPALGAFNVPQVHAVTATCARVAVKQDLAAGSGHRAVSETRTGSHQGIAIGETATMPKAKRWTWTEATRECPQTISLIEAMVKKVMTAEEIRDALITIAGVMREARRAEKKARRKKETR